MNRRRWFALGLVIGVVLLLSPVFALLLNMLTMQEAVRSPNPSPSQMAESISRNMVTMLKSLGSGLLGLVLSAICAWQLIRKPRPDERA